MSQTLTMLRRARSLLLLVGFAAVAAAPKPVLAQSASVQAQALFDSGRKLMDAGKYAEACTAFESSQKLDPAISTLLNLADCREHNRQLATAWGTFVDANRMARQANNPKFATVAQNHARGLEPRLSRLAISVPSRSQVPDLEILRGSDAVNPAAWNNPLPIDGGTYTITARAPGHVTWKTVRTIKPESDNATIEIPRLVEERSEAMRSGTAAAAGPGGKAPPAVAATEPVRPAPTPAPAPPARVATVEPPAPAGPIDDGAATRSHLPVVPIALGAGAVVLGGTALGLHLWANGTYDDARALNEQPDMAAAAEKLRQKAIHRRYAAQGFAGAAVACAGVAVYLYIRDRSAARSETVGVTPVASPQFAGLAVVGAW